MKPSQRAAIAVEYMRVFQVEAKTRQIRKPANSVRENFPEQNGRAADQAGEALGVTGRTVRDAAFVKETVIRQLR